MIFEGVVEKSWADCSKEKEGLFPQICVNTVQSFKHHALLSLVGWRKISINTKFH
jgi:hypothetical protein